MSQVLRLERTVGSIVEKNVEMLCPADVINMLKSELPIIFTRCIPMKASSPGNRIGNAAFMTSNTAEITPAQSMVVNIVAMPMPIALQSTDCKASASAERNPIAKLLICVPNVAQSRFARNVPSVRIAIVNFAAKSAPSCAPSTLSRRPLTNPASLAPSPFQSKVVRKLYPKTMPFCSIVPSFCPHE